MKSYSLSYKIIRGLLFVVQCKQQDCKKVAKIKSFLKWSSARFNESSNSLPSGNNVPLIVSHNGGMHRMNQFLLVRFISLYHQRFRESQIGMWTRNVNNVKLIKHWAAFDGAIAVQSLLMLVWHVRSMQELTIIVKRNHRPGNQPVPSWTSYRMKNWIKRNTTNHGEKLWQSVGFCKNAIKPYRTTANETHRYVF